MIQKVDEREREREIVCRVQRRFDLKLLLALRTVERERRSLPAFAAHEINPTAAADNVPAAMLPVPALRHGQPVCISTFAEADELDLYHGFAADAQIRSPVPERILVRVPFDLSTGTAYKEQWIHGGDNRPFLPARLRRQHIIGVLIDLCRKVNQCRRPIRTRALKGIHVPADYAQKSFGVDILQRYAVPTIHMNRIVHTAAPRGEVRPTPGQIFIQCLVNAPSHLIFPGCHTNPLYSIATMSCLSVSRRLSITLK